MSAGTRRVTGVWVPIVSLALTWAVAAGAGGFGIEVRLPDSHDARQRGALLVVRPAGCMGPGASVSATAEGLVGGQRRSVPVALALVARGSGKDPLDTYVVKRQWPVRGAWVLLITARSGDRATTRAMVEMAPGGSVRTTTNARGNKQVVVRYPGEDVNAAIRAALQAIAGRSTGATASAAH